VTNILGHNSWQEKGKKNVNVKPSSCVKSYFEVVRDYCQERDDNDIRIEGWLPVGNVDGKDNWMDFGIWRPLSEEEVAAVEEETSEGEECPLVMTETGFVPAIDC